MHMLLADTEEFAQAIGKQKGSRASVYIVVNWRSYIFFCSVPVCTVCDGRKHGQCKRSLSRRIRLNADEPQGIAIAFRFQRPLLVPQQARAIELDILRL